MANRPARVATLIIATATASCGKSKVVDDSAAGTEQATTSRVGSQPTTNSTKPACPSTGKWAVCSIEKRLKSAGLVARRDSADTSTRAGFSVKPAAYALGRDSHFDLFIYPDEAALAGDISKMDTLRVAPLGKKGAWAIPPILIRSGNLAAVLITKDAREADRVTLAITAGAPQPAR